MHIQAQKAVETLLSAVPKRAAIVLERRFGLGKGNRRYTLEAIGKTYGITRERVRQIERDGLQRIKKSSVYKEFFPTFALFKEYLSSQGGVLTEESLVHHFTEDPRDASFVRFLVMLTPHLVYRGEDMSFRARWACDPPNMDKVERVLRTTAAEARVHSGVVATPELIAAVARHSAGEALLDSTDEIALQRLAISRELAHNFFGEWGHISSPLVRPRGVRDMAYLVFQKEGKPLHFLQAAERIRSMVAPRKVHVQTVHNELIKDIRFILVGRGTYGLAEWGYEAGTVRDIITRVLSRGPLPREGIVSAVLQKRNVKENTILINLQNRKHFKRLEDDRYSNTV